MEQSILDTFSRTLNEYENLICEAKALISLAREGNDVETRMVNFEFPIIIDEMHCRIETLLEAYKRTFPYRSREMPLTQKEIGLL